MARLLETPWTRPPGRRLDISLGRFIPNSTRGTQAPILAALDPVPDASFTPEHVLELVPTPGASPEAPAAQLLERLFEHGRALGFARIGVSPPDVSPQDQAAFSRWLDSGYQGNMRFLERPRVSPRELLPGARCVLVAVLSYGARSLEATDVPIAAYARGQDYHSVLREKLRALAQRCCDLAGRPIRARICVDSAPLLERALAANAGIGFVGKSTLLISPGVGTATLLGELILDLELPLAQPSGDGCGECTRCLDACPTSAFPSAYTLDARRCISYLTIEHRGPIDRSLRAQLGSHVFGCDICQRVCPYNASRKLPDAAEELSPRYTVTALEALQLLEMTTGDYRRLVRGSALRRASRPQLQRNAAIALGNARDPIAVPALARSLESHPDPVVRGHAAWALGRIGTEAARTALEAATAREGDESVLDEVRLALVPAEKGS